MADTGTITKTASKALEKAKPSEGLSDPKSLAAAGAALLALPYAAQGIAKLAGGARSKAGGGLSSLKDKATDTAKDVAGEVTDEKLKPDVGGMFGGLFGGGSDDDEDDDEGADRDAVGSGRRMPIQQSVDVAAPLKDTYNLWTQFEEWPSYMHRVDKADQADEVTVEMATKVWGITKRFTAEIQEQRPDERIEWHVQEGLTHTGVVTFHELAPRLTRIEVSLDVQPEGLLEKAGRGMRFAKRAVRGDLHRFKAHAEMLEQSSEGWRGTIEDGEVKRKASRKSSSSNGSSGSSSRGRSRNGGDPASGSRKSGSRN